MRWRERMKFVRSKRRLARLAGSYREHGTPVPDVVAEAVRALDAVEAVIELDLGAIERGLRAHEDTAIDDALVFLEVDPYFFRSGYRKNWIWRGLGHFDLSDVHRERVRSLLVRAVDTGSSGHCPGGWRMARRYANNTLRRAFRAQLHALDPVVQLRALAMLARVKRPELSAADFALAQAIVARLGGESRYGGPNWLRPLERRFGPDAERPGP